MDFTLVFNRWHSKVIVIAIIWSIWNLGSTNMNLKMMVKCGCCGETTLRREFWKEEGLEKSIRMLAWNSQIRINLAANLERNKSLNFNPVVIFLYFWSCSMTENSLLKVVHSFLLSQYWDNSVYQSVNQSATPQVIFLFISLSINQLCLNMSPL